MSNINDEVEVKEIDESAVEDMTNDLREDNFKVASSQAKPFVKPTLHVDMPAGETLSAAQVIAISKLVEQETRKAVENATFDSSMAGQVVPKRVVPITDFSKLSLADVYDLSIPIEAKPFMSADVLAIKLKDTNYEARWVNKNPQRLGEMIAKGFTYICEDDIINADGIQTGVDAEDHYSFNDVVAMKIDKATYYRALRAAHERAVMTTDQSNSRKRAANQANSYMQKESGVGNDFAAAARNKKMVFYDPEIGI